jgi:hypothetical protein
MAKERNELSLPFLVVEPKIVTASRQTNTKIGVNKKFEGLTNARETCTN